MFKLNEFKKNIDKDAGIDSNKESKKPRSWTEESLASASSLYSADTTRMTTTSTNALSSLSPSSSDTTRLTLTPTNVPPSFLKDAYEEKIKPEEIYFLTELEREWSETRPFSGLHILVNAHMTLITLAQINLLIAAGAAEVETTASPELVTHQDTLDAIQQAGITFYAHGAIPIEKRQNYYDIVYDCGAGMLDIVIPKKGMVELTHTDPKLYTSTSFPVITVDNSDTKLLETSFGTGDSLVRLLRTLSEKTRMTALQSLVTKEGNDLFDSENKRNAFFALALFDLQKWISDKYMIFGYGKVGKGIACALRHAKVPQENIYIVETTPDAYLRLKGDGYNNAILHANSDTKLQILSLLKLDGTGTPNIQFVITATGVKNAISTGFEAKDFADVPCLINMGTPDEFGYNFEADQILNKKKPANFMLERPTEVRYLDAIFWIWAYGGFELLSLQKKYYGDSKEGNDLHQVVVPEVGVANINGLRNISKKMDHKILGMWLNKYPEVWLLPSAPESLKEIGRAAQMYSAAGADASITKRNIFSLLQMDDEKDENQSAPSFPPK